MKKKEKSESDYKLIEKLISFMSFSTKLKIAQEEKKASISKGNTQK